MCLAGDSWWLQQEQSGLALGKEVSEKDRVNKTPLRKGAPLISQRGRLSREGGKGKHRGAAGCGGVWKQDPAQGFLQAAQSQQGTLGWITLPGGAWLPSQALGCRTWMHTIWVALPLC